MARLVQDLVRDPDTAPRCFSIDARSCDLVELVREQVDVALARASQHSIVFDHPEQLSVSCDPERLAQVIANLLNNALAHTPGGEVRVRLWTDNEEAYLSVCDSGPGIPDDSLQAIFEPRVRLGSSESATQPSGAGLGLSIAHEIVTAHLGRIWVENNPDCGATFTLALPLSAG